MKLRAWADRIERVHVLDRPGNVIRSAIVKVPARVRDVLHGVWLGHPLHPLGVMVPIGSWLTGTLLDALRIPGKGSTVLIGVGSASAVPAAITGLNDWASLTREQRRTGLVHATANVAALSLNVASLVAGARGNVTLARRLRYAGLAAVSAGGYLGGHLAYRQAAAVNHASPLLDRIPEGWHDVCDMAALTPGKTHTYHVGDVPVLVARHNGGATVMIERCAHQTGPLGEGEVRQIDGTDCVVCPWHGSTYRLTDGVSVRGPAATSQPTLRTRVLNGRLEASLP